MKTALIIALAIASSVTAQPVIDCRMNIVPNLVGMSFENAEQKWHQSGFQSPIFPNRFCEQEQPDTCTLVIVQQSTPAGTIECFYAPIAVIMQ